MSNTSSPDGVEVWALELRPDGHRFEAGAGQVSYDLKIFAQNFCPTPALNRRSFSMTEISLC